MKNFLKDEYCEANGIPELIPVLQSWITAQRDYVKAVVDDHPWNYGERSSVGFLAAGVWRSGGVALEEWQTEKGSKAKCRQGRCDLWVFRPQQYDFHIEAKYMRSRATGKPVKERTYIERALLNATTDAQALTCPRKNQLGILFVAPFYPTGKHEGMHEHITMWLKDIYAIPHSAIAWIINRKGLRPSPGNVCPGLVLIARAALPRK